MVIKDNKELVTGKKYLYLTKRGNIYFFKVISINDYYIEYIFDHWEKASRPSTNNLTDFGKGEATTIIASKLIDILYG